MEKDKAYLRHMSDECSYLLQISRETPVSSIIRDPTLQRAVVRSIEVLGEALKKHLPSAQRPESGHPLGRYCRHPGILAHRYFGVDWDIVADVVSNEIPRLQARIGIILAQIGNEK